MRTQEERMTAFTWPHSVLTVAGASHHSRATGLRAAGPTNGHAGQFYVLPDGHIIAVTHYADLGLQFPPGYSNPVTGARGWVALSFRACCHVAPVIPSYGHGT